MYRLPTPPGRWHNWRSTSIFRVFAYSIAGLRPATFAYTRDEANAVWTRENFLKMLGILSELQQPAEQHLLAHSMGNRVVFQGLQRLEGMRFGQVILAAPDEDAGVFESQMPRFLGHAQRNTLYASKKDLALRLSNWVHGYERGGQAGVAGLDSIDASAVNFSVVGAVLTTRLPAKHLRRPLPNPFPSLNQASQCYTARHEGRRNRRSSCQATT
jgi:hypothetical protein